MKQPGDAEYRPSWGEVFKELECSATRKPAKGAFLGGTPTRIWWQWGSPYNPHPISWKESSDETDQGRERDDSNCDDDVLRADNVGWLRPRREILAQQGTTCSADSASDRGRRSASIGMESSDRQIAHPRGSW